MEARAKSHSTSDFIDFASKFTESPIPPFARMNYETRTTGTATTTIG